MKLTLPTLISDADEALSRTGERLDIGRFVARYFPHDIEAGQLLERAFHAGLLRGQLNTNSAKLEGHISAIADRTRPVWH